MEDRHLEQLPVVIVIALLFECFEATGGLHPGYLTVFKPNGKD